MWIYKLEPFLSNLNNLKHDFTKHLDVLIQI